MPIPGSLLAPPSVEAHRTAAYPAMSWHGVDGSEWTFGMDLRISPVLVMPGVQGLDMPPGTLFTDDTPQVAGSRYSGSHVDPRPVFLPLHIEGANRAEAKALRRAFLLSLQPFSDLYGTLTIAEPDGTRRHLDCRYTGGGDPSAEGAKWAQYGINLIADENPFWYGDPVTPSPWTLAAPPAFFPLRPFPFTLGSSQVLGSTSVINAGDVEAYPVWTLTGPASSLTLSLGDRSLTVAHTIDGAGRIVIDTSPLAETIVDGNGDTLWGSVPAGYDLWALPPGVSPITIAVSGGDPSTRLSMTYRPLYLSA